jgi:hypothetical protein
MSVFSILHQILVEHLSRRSNLFVLSFTSPSYHFLMFALYLKLVDPIENRCKDEEVRGQATRDLLKFILDHKTAAKSLPTPEQEAVSSVTITLLFLCTLIKYICM